MPDQSEGEQAQDVAEQLLEGRPPGEQVGFSLGGMHEHESEDHPYGVRATNATKNVDGSVTAETLAPTETAETTDEAAP